MSWKIALAAVLGIAAGWSLRPALSPQVPGHAAQEVDEEAGVNSGISDDASQNQSDSNQFVSQSDVQGDLTSGNPSGPSGEGVGQAISSRQGAYGGTSGALAVPAENECISMLKPSSIIKWEAAWNQQVAEQLKTNDFLWTGGDARGPAPRALEDLVGLYVGKVKLSSSPETEIELTMRLRSETDGFISFKATFPDGEKKSVRSCDHDFDPRSDLGGDPQTGTVNVVWINCLREALPEIVQLGFKLPVAGGKSGMSQHDLFGFDENFAWKNVGSIELQRPRK